MKYKFTVVFSEVIHRTHDVEVEAEDLEGARSLMDRAGLDADKTFDFAVQGQDLGFVFDWKDTVLPVEDEKELEGVGSEVSRFFDTPVYAFDWITRLTPEQQAIEDVEEERLKNSGSGVSHF